MTPDGTPNTDRPKVTVCVMTYNQRAYIGQCLLSLLSQETNFDFEVVVVDDCSTDGTSEIVQGIADKHLNRMRYMRHERNNGASSTFRFAREMGKGIYVAHVDGDDYALPGKLQAQADFLDLNEGCQIVWHRMMILDALTGSIHPQACNRVPADNVKYDISDLICNITIGLHSSKMYRRWQRGADQGLDPLDFSENVLHLLNAGGYAAVMDSEPFGVYRAGIGISRERSSIRKKTYSWMHYFFKCGHAPMALICSQVLLMVLSDLKHRERSFWYGLSKLLLMVFRAIPHRIFECRRRRVDFSPAVVAGSQPRSSATSEEAKQC